MQQGKIWVFKFSSFFIQWTDVMDSETGSMKFVEPVSVHFLFLFCLFCRFK